MFFDTYWSAVWWSEGGMWWFGQLGPTTITYVGDKFVYPTIEGDMTGDGIVDVSDVNAIINIILHKN
ncbi:MAG: hypothetical protein J6S96_03870 [Muribaculaceae bacterium]|nr:hypothetical protein [Muribaculaceae bacterium]